MNTVVMQNKISSSQNNTWKSVIDEKKSFSTDDMIDAYEKGLKDGVEKLIEVKRNKLLTNLLSAQEKAELFFDLINKEDEICSSVYLRISNESKFDLLYAIKDQIFFQPKLSREIYSKSIEFELSNKFINISFIPNIKDLNINRLTADNYLFSYEPNSKSH